MYKQLCLAGVCIGWLLAACTPHFISNEAERAEAGRRFNCRQEALQGSGLFAIFTADSLQTEEREALEFLYAYMPLGDVTDYDGSFHLRNVRSALRARKEMPWGDSIPEREFRHFVLPARVNNENLDEARQVFYAELKDRVKHLPLRDAVLEINHWCHEKVTYQPSDMRTSAPLATMQTAHGRCGEESTFAVAAFRAMCIPARQVYTPRWAHTDDNHAWVEVWVDGQWHFLGACEPEPVLDLAWFNAPASRGMLMHTKVFGHYYGPEEVMDVTDNYTEINVIGNYAETAPVQIAVVDGRQQPVSGAHVEFKLYNYAEFYTVARKTTDREGRASLTAGLGDMLVWASKDGKCGYRKCSFGKDSVLTIALQPAGTALADTDLDLVPPAEKPRLPRVSDLQRTANTQRLLREDSIRNRYTASFPTTENNREFLRGLRLPEPALLPILAASRGNHATLRRFLQNSATDEPGRTLCQGLLGVLSEKDWRDVSLATLEDHLRHTPPSTVPCDADTYVRYVVNPRVAHEMISPYKAYLSAALARILPAEQPGAPRHTLQDLARWCRDSIRLCNEWNPQRIPMSPTGVFRARMADSHSLDIFFVAAARSLGIPARIDGVTGKVQHWQPSGWQDIALAQPSAHEASPRPQGILKATYRPTRILDDPKYYTHFTLSKVTDNNRLQLLNYPEGTTTWSNLLREGTPLDAGQYQLVSGTRLANGGVLARMVFFTIRPGQTTSVELNLREPVNAVQVIGSFNSENLYTPAGQTGAKSLLSTTGRGYYIIGIVGAGQEPTNHALRDIAALRSDFETWGRPLVLLFPSEEQRKRFRIDDLPPMPGTTAWGVDHSGKILREIAESMKLPEHPSLPVFLIADTFNRVVFVSQGYTIGLGEQLMKTIRQL